MAPEPGPGGEGAPDRGGPLAGFHVGIVVSERDEPSLRLAEAAGRWLRAEGADVSRYPAAAAFEVAQLAGWLAESGRVDGIVACASIVRGETSHDRHLAEAVTGGLLEIGIRTRIPVGNAVLTVDTSAQADARSGGAKGNRGEDAARAVAGLLRARKRLGERRLGERPGLDLGPASGFRGEG